MHILIQLFRWIYDHALSLWVSKETGEIATRAAFVTAVIVTITVIYAAYAAAISSLAMSIPAEFSLAMVIIPDNTPACFTILTTLRIALFIASLKLGLASVGVK